MEQRISATELARRLGDVLGRVRYRGDSFVIERNGSAVARLVPLPDKSVVTIREALDAWRAAGRPDGAFAAALDAVGDTDRPPDNPWGS
ncbi:MAG: type II toxin-antitoxin system Phd/YefM family antitoxin [Candidatus Rokuibacteriota bacterium]